MALYFYNTISWMNNKKNLISLPKKATAWWSDRKSEAPLLIQTKLLSHCTHHCIRFHRYSGNSHNYRTTVHETHQCSHHQKPDTTNSKVLQLLAWRRSRLPEGGHHLEWTQGKNQSTFKRVLSAISEVVHVSMLRNGSLWRTNLTVATWETTARCVISGVARRGRSSDTFGQCTENKPGGAGTAEKRSTGKTTWEPTKPPSTAIHRKTKL